MIATTSLVFDKGWLVLVRCRPEMTISKWRSALPATPTFSKSIAVSAKARCEERGFARGDVQSRLEVWICGDGGEVY